MDGLIPGYVLDNAGLVVGQNHALVNPPQRVGVSGGFAVVDAACRGLDVSEVTTGLAGRG